MHIFVGLVALKLNCLESIYIERGEFSVKTTTRKIQVTVSYQFSSSLLFAPISTSHNILKNIFSLSSSWLAPLTAVRRTNLESTNTKTFTSLRDRVEAPILQIFIVVPVETIIYGRRLQ
jgi:hypothetical protein